MLQIHPSTSTSFGEQYAFQVRHGEMYSVSVCGERIRSKADSIALIRSLDNAASSLPAPESSATRRLSVRIVYTDGTPCEYHAPLFAPCSSAKTEREAADEGSKSIDYNVGRVTTPFYKLGVKVRLHDTAANRAAVATVRATSDAMHCTGTLSVLDRDIESSYRHGGDIGMPRTSSETTTTGSTRVMLSVCARDTQDLVSEGESDSSSSNRDSDRDSDSSRDLEFDPSRSRLKKKPRSGRERRQQVRMEARG